MYCTEVVAEDEPWVDALKTGDDWIESTITWNNKPNVGDSIAYTMVWPEEEWFSWDITSYVVAEHGGDGIVSVAMGILTPWFVGTTFDSKEGTNKPYLEITYGSQEGVPEFGINVAIITSVAAALMFALKRPRK